MKKMMYSRQHLAVLKVLRQIREEAGLTQAELASKIEHPQSYVSKYENGERRLNIVDLVVLCEALNVSLTSFAAKLEKELAVPASRRTTGKSPKS